MRDAACKRLSTSPFVGINRFKFTGYDLSPSVVEWGTPLVKHAPKLLKKTETSIICSSNFDAVAPGAGSCRWDIWHFFINFAEKSVAP